MPADRWLQARRLLVACPGGPQVLAPALPALRLLRQVLPEANLTLWTPACPADLEAKLPPIRELLLRPLTPGATLRPLINAIKNRDFDAAIIFTGFEESPYPAAYVCYLAGVPLRLGQSREFGGGVLSLWVQPPHRVQPQHNVAGLEQHHLQLLQEAGLSGRQVATETG